MILNNQTLLNITDINRTYTDDSGGTVEAGLGLNLSVKRGEFVSFIGSSGCGKTTLLRLIAGLDFPESGTIEFALSEAEAGSNKFGYVFQQGGLFPWLTVEKNIAAGLSAGGRKADPALVAHYIGLIGLSGFEKSFTHEISGVMAQRVAIARALIGNPVILLLDEPMGALDAFTRADIQDKLLAIRKESNVTTLLVTHDADEAIYLSDRIVIMTPRPGKINEIIDVKLTHPRRRSSSEFLRLRKEILEKLHLASTEPEPEYTI